jgi:hypothetical protein
MKKTEGWWKWKQISIYKLFQIKQIRTKSKKKQLNGWIKNLEGQTWKSRSEKTRKKEKVIDEKIEVCLPYTPLRDGETARTIQALPWKPQFGHQTTPICVAQMTQQLCTCQLLFFSFIFIQLLNCPSIKLIITKKNDENTKNL